MLKKLRIQFVAVIMVIVTAMLCLIFGMLCYFMQKNMENESINMMQSIAANPFQLFRPDDAGDMPRLPFFMLQIGNNGEIIATGGGYFDLSDEAFLNDLVSAVFASRGHNGILKEYNLRFCRTESPRGQCLVFADMTSEQSILKSLVRNCVGLGLLCFFLFLGISVLLAFWMVKPVDQAWKQQRQFVSDASHELKTPLTVIMANAEMLQAPDYDQQSKAQLSESILTMSRQMRTLVERLLELARADNDQSKISFSPLDFSHLTEKALLPFEAVLFERGLSLSSQLQEGITVNGSEQHLHQVLDIFLDNAQKYALAPSEVTVQLEKVNRHFCRLTVSNRGEPISNEDLKNIFKRFYRVDKARSRDGSFGLGLSIAESIVLSHGGKIWAESKNGINSFYVQLPVRG